MPSIVWNPQPVSDTGAATTGAGGVLEYPIRPIDAAGELATEVLFYNDFTDEVLGVVAGDIVCDDITANSVVSLGGVSATRVISANVVSGILTFSSLNSPNAAVTATDTTISHKIPVVMNGVTYYIALTTGQ